MPLNPVKSTHVGDWLHFSSRYGVTAAYNANIRPVMVPSLRQPNNAEKAMCFDIIDNLSEGEDLVRKIVNSVC